MNMKKKGRFFRSIAFTTIEMIVVMIVMAFLAAIAVPTIGNMIGNTRVRVTEKEMTELARAILGDPENGLPGYLSENGAFPDGPMTRLYAFAAPACSPYNPFTRTGWNGPYIDTSRKDIDGNGTIGAGEYDILHDEWGSAYVLDDTVSPAVIRSTGPDMAPGGGDDIAVPLE